MTVFVVYDTVHGYVYGVFSTRELALEHADGAYDALFECIVDSEVVNV